jgi:hypothetical protein
MAEAIPQPSSAADEGDSGATASDGFDSTERAAAAPDGQPRARKTPEEIIKGLQSENDRMKGKFGRLLSSNYAKTLGADGIIRALEQFEAILAHPETAENVKVGLKQSAAGQWEYAPVSRQKAAQVDADAGMGGDYEDPTVKAIKAYIDERMNPLIEQVGSLRQRNETALQAGGQQKIADMTRRFLSEYPLEGDERSQFAEALSADIANLDPTMLLRMEYDQFKKRVGLPNIEPFLPASLARRAKQNGTRLAGFATDAGLAGSQGAEQAPARGKPMTWAQMQKANALAAERAAREPA